MEYRRFGRGILACLFIAIGNVFIMCYHHDADPQSLPSEVFEIPDARYIEAVKQARYFARNLIIDENLPGLSVAIAVDNKLVWAEGFGWADLKKRIPVTPLTQFRIGGTSKALTAAAAGLLYERGLLDLDAPVQEYVPGFPKKKWEISTRQLMGHVAGIRHYSHEDELFSHKDHKTVIEGLEYFASDPLLFKPSTAYHYSSYGWVLVGAVIQSVAREPYLNFMESEIFNPLDMKNTVPDYAGRVLPNRASLYRPFMTTNTRFGLENEGEADLSGKLSALGFLSTPLDLIRFGIAILEGSLLKPETVEMLQTAQQLKSGKLTEAGLGWLIRNVSIGEGAATSTVFEAPGESVGGTASFKIFPEQRMVIAVVSNVSYARGVSPFGISLAWLFSQK